MLKIKKSERRSVYNSTNIKKQLSSAQNTPALQVKSGVKSKHTFPQVHMYMHMPHPSSYVTNGLTKNVAARKCDTV